MFVSVIHNCGCMKFSSIDPLVASPHRAKHHGKEYIVWQCLVCLKLLVHHTSLVMWESCVIT